MLARVSDQENCVALHFVAKFHADPPPPGNRGERPRLRKRAKGFEPARRERPRERGLRVVLGNRIVEKVSAKDGYLQTAHRCRPADVGIKLIARADPTIVAVREGDPIAMLEVDSGCDVTSIAKGEVMDEAYAVSELRHSRNCEVKVSIADHSVSCEVEAHFIIFGVDCTEIGGKEKGGRNGKPPLELEPKDSCIRSIEDRLRNPCCCRREVHFPLHVRNFGQEDGAIQGELAVECLDLGTEFERIDVFFVERERSCLRNLGKEGSRAGDPEIVSARAHALRVGGVNLAVVKGILHPHLGDPVFPAILVFKTVRLARGEGIGADRRTGLIDNTAAGPRPDIGHRHVLVFLGVAQTCDKLEISDNLEIDLDECAIDLVVLTSATVELGRGDGRQVAPFGVGDFLLEIVEASADDCRAEFATIA